jgi:hypothetical protein
MRTFILAKISLCKNGFISLVLCSYFSLFTILILHITYLLINHTHFLVSLTDYIACYAEALSGLRAINEVSQLTPILTQELPPTVKDFESIPKITIENFKFCLLKTANHVYSFSQKNTSICILNARYSVENSIMLLFDLSLYFRR